MHNTDAPSRKRMAGLAMAAQTTERRRFSPLERPLIVIPPARMPPMRVASLSCRPASCRKRVYGIYWVRLRLTSNPNPYHTRSLTKRRVSMRLRFST